MRPGSTGVLVPGAKAPDTRPLLSLLHELARTNRLVLTATRIEAVRSFRAWTLSHMSGSTLSVVVHRIVPVFALVDAPAVDLAVGRHVIDRYEAELERSCEVGWHRLGSAEAQVTANSKVTAGLAAAELKEIAYWKPATVGELLFNHWD